jgi:OFA family oxalate/formate antiporter-like MFS transporter
VLTAVGAFAILFLSCSRVVWGVLLGRLGLGCIYPLVLVGNGTLALAMWILPITPSSLLLMLLGVYFCYGGHLAIFPALAAKIFGMRYGPQVFGLMSLGLAVGGIVSWGLIYLKVMIGYRGVLFI